MCNGTRRCRLSGEEPRSFKLICSVVSGMLAGATRAVAEWMLSTLGH